MTVETIFKNSLHRHKTPADQLLLSNGSQVAVRKNVSTTHVDIVIPVYNEAAGLRTSAERLVSYLEQDFPYNYLITIIDNGSSDATWEIAQQLAVEYPRQIVGIQLHEKGRGRALKHAWSNSTADVLVYMDVDLSTDLRSLEPLVTPLVQKIAAVATGSRLSANSQVERSLKREFISRSYNFILRRSLRFKTSDAQCGFKAIRADVAAQLLPQVADDDWFFDTELLARAEHQGLVIHEVPVSWREDPDSRVHLLKTSIEDLKGVKRLRGEFSQRPTWEKRTIALIIILATALYIYGMSKNGYANSFYAAAVQAGTHNLRAFFFGSLDGSNFITVDKPPFSLWVMEISTRIFGFHTWSMLLPDALAGTATVYVVYASVRRWFSAQSALLAAGVMALTPVAVLMFGFDNPDAILTLLLAGSVYAFLRAIENTAPLRWLILAGVLTGCAFNTKMLQGLFVVPILSIAYLVLARPPFLTRLKQLAITAVPTAIAGLWWPVIITLIPKASRPYIGSSSNDSIWNLIFGYNGFNRLLGSGTGQGGVSSAHRSVISKANLPAGLTNFPRAPAGGFGGGHGGPGSSGFGGSTGIFRMFDSDFGPNIAWFIALALIGALLALWLTRRAPRSDKTRIAVLVWGGYLIIHIVLFSIVSGVIHPYYPVAMAPAIAALVGITVPIMLKSYRSRSASALILPIAVAATGIIACIILGYQPDWLPWLRWSVLVTSLVASVGLLIQLYLPIKRFVVPLLVIAAISGGSGPLANSVSTVMQKHTGSIPTAGPSATGMAGSNNESATAERSFVQYLLAHKDSARWLVAVASANQSAPIQISSGQPVMAIGGFDGSDKALTITQLKLLINKGQLRYYALKTGGQGFGGGAGGNGNSAITQYLIAHGTLVNYGGTGYSLYKLH